MQIIKHPKKSEWSRLLKRPAIDSSSLEASVTNILHQVKASGDEALKRFATIYDKVSVAELLVSKEEIDAASSTISSELKDAIALAKKNIETFHAKQVGTVEKVETMPGVVCWRKSVAIEKVGLYIPGGTAPLFSTILMLSIPAKIAGCKEIILCTPPGKDGKINAAILYTAKLVGITKIFKTGGAQAIAAMAYGTESVPQVYKIFGPGNQYVTCAKQLVQKDGVAIDMPAGPSEVCVMADDAANPSFVAADLLSQAEHGVDSQVLLVSNSEAMINDVLIETAKQLEQLPRKEFAAKALENSKAILLHTTTEMIELVNEYAAEHLIISCKDDEVIAEQIINAGSIFLGNYSPESVGDYASGTNHTLPTNGYAKAYSGVSVDSFVKKITYQKLTKEGLQHIGKAVELMAEAEGLEAHANAVKKRIQDIGKRS
ncbi:histidinol dehydrogenase [Lacibacter sediminis]|uniref:Histidinol dehydrogenase n=1 Tax=Lacibacter sediminis TaxID=2760713 RepID=A0A7G5XBR9_9BACT|nr:histidinol dehydrogenase [Lacibacter sediminis]QNA42922.1 histidinol dehydrogenase [Lacibacter sediminis]